MLQSSSRSDHLIERIPQKQTSKPTSDILFFPLHDIRNKARRRKGLLILETLAYELQTNRRSLIPLRTILGPLARINLAPGAIPTIHRIQLRVNDQPARENNTGIVEDIPDSGVIPVLRFAHHCRRADIDRAEDEVYVAGFHEGVVRVAVGVALAVQGPVLGDAERGGAAVGEGPFS
jgi:hypothetical protein